MLRLYVWGSRRPYNITLFRGKYRVQSTRLRSWDYAAAGWYFVTICTRGGECSFGDVIDGQMRLSPIGDVACRYWVGTPEHVENVTLDSFIVMPNHVHGIVIIEKKARSGCQDATGSDGCRDVASPGARPSACNVSTDTVESRHHCMPRILPKAGSLSAIVRSYKAAVTRCCRQNGYSTFAWQPRFYDHIIRNEESVRRMREYIENNPLKWELDKYHPARW
ncbi:MAG TPA: transposase [Anaerolineae bacterium]|nr:transposase [Anaerolineae bacterium]